MNYEVKWDKCTNNFFIHGSKVSFSKEDNEVHFENPNISPGSVIVGWDSEISYQGARTTLQLPLLKQGETYRLKVDVFVHPEKTVALKFNVFDRAQTRISTQIIPLEGGEVTYPKGGYSYTIELISTGVETMCFKRIWILQTQGGDA